MRTLGEQLKPYLWEKGVSGNPGGRPKGAAGIAAYIAKKTRNFRDLVDTMVRIAADDDREADQIQAIKWLADRGLGKVPETLEMTGSLTIETIIQEVEKAQGAGLLPQRVMVN